MNSYKFLKLQFALFLKDEIKLRPDKLSVEITEFTGNIFDGLPIIVPVIDIPNLPETLYLQLRSDKKDLTCNFSKSRIDLIYEPESSNFSLDFFEHEKRIGLIIGKLFNFVMKHVSVKRLGLVNDYFITDDNPTIFLRDKYIKKNIEGLNNIALRFEQKVKNESDMIFNIITSIDSAVTVRGVSGNGFFLQKDVNTAKEVDYVFDEKRLNDFMNFAAVYFSFSDIEKFLT